MGPCLSRGSGRQASRSNVDVTEKTDVAGVPERTNQLITLRPTWLASTPLTRDELKRRREEFWTSCPHFLGQPSTWQALKLACDAPSLDAAQTVLNQNGIVAYDGTLLRTVDAVGNTYVLPTFCVSEPSNVTAGPVSDTSPNPTAAVVDYQWTLRFTNGLKDATYTVKSCETIANVQARIYQDLKVPVSHQRWFYSGRPLSDSLTAQEAKIPCSHVIQIMVKS